MTRLLAFDTSTEAMSIALCLAEHTLVFEGDGGAQASDRLIPEILALLARGGCTLNEMDAIGFGRGPGAFTGLRTACAVAQGLALGIGKPVLPLDSLMLVAQDAAEPDVWVAMDARMNEIYAAHYQRSGPREPWHTRVAPALCSLDALHSQWQAVPPLCVAGSAIDAFGAALKVGSARTLPVARSRATALAQLARAAWQQGEAVDAALALPVYLRDKVAQTTAERDAARAAREAV